ncbi:MAG: hypothetical protein OXF32_07230 [Anaerolineaceae bacterium]|nr:hypothetical protein [Anaerolineaceae bacterium]
MDSPQTTLESMTTFALAASDGQLFAGRAGGLYRSPDGGASWEYASGQPGEEGAIATTSLAARGRDIFAGINGGVLRSSDGGGTWFTAALSNPPPLVVALALSPAYEEDGALLAGSAEDGIFASTDRGVTWRGWNFGLIDLNVNALAWATPSLAFAGTESGIFHSRNGGRAWRPLPFPMDLAPVISLQLSPDFETDGTLFAGTEEHGLRVSRDGGATWGAVALPVEGEAVNAMANTAQGLALTLDEYLLLGREGGATWETLRHLPGQTGLALLAQGDRLVLALSGGEVVSLEI